MCAPRGRCASVFPHTTSLRLLMAAYCPPGGGFDNSPVIHPGEVRDSVPVSPVGPAERVAITRRSQPSGTHTTAANPTRATCAPGRVNRRSLHAGDRLLQADALRRATA